jgi:pyridoxine 5-phosphate synthase
MRVSVFLEADPEQVKAAHDLGADRIELYTESYAAGYAKDRMSAVRPFLEAAEQAQKIGIGLNAGHDLDLNNLRYFAGTLPDLLEVSIGHALISDALYFGLENSIRMYLRELELAEVMGAG